MPDESQSQTPSAQQPSHPPWREGHRGERIAPATNRIDRERVDSALELLAVRINELDEVTEPKPAWLSEAKAYAETAMHNRRARRLNATWAAVMAAERSLLGGCTRHELELEARRVAAEAATKTEGWRQACVGAVWSTTPEDGPNLEPVSTEELLEDVAGARRIVDEAQANMYWKQAYQRHQMANSAQGLTIMLLTTVVVLAFVLAQDWDPAAGESLLSDMRSLVVVIVLGGLGASLSGMLTVLRRDMTGTIPEIRGQWTLIRYRPMIGAVSAIAIVGILQSGIGGLSIDPEAAFVAAFLAGFSERLVSDALLRASANVTS